MFSKRFMTCFRKICKIKCLKFSEKICRKIHEITGHVPTPVDLFNNLVDPPVARNCFSNVPVVPVWFRWFVQQF